MIAWYFVKTNQSLQLKTITKFQYSFLCDQNGTWNGGVRDIMDGVADLAGAPFTATQIRSTVVDFSVPLVEIVCRFFIKNPEVHT